jgi:hypothetical protein
MKFTSFVILNLVIITNILAVKKKQKKKGDRASTYGGNKNQQAQKHKEIIKDANKEDELVKNNGVSPDKELKQNGAGSLSSPTNTTSDDKSDNESLDSSKTSKSELDDASTNKELKDATKDTTKPTPPNMSKPPLLDNQEKNAPLNEEDVSKLNSLTDDNKETKKSLDDLKLPSDDNIENLAGPKTDVDTKTEDSLEKSTSDKKGKPLDDQNSNKNKKIEVGADNPAKQSEVEEKKNASKTETVASKPVEVALDKSKETTSKTSTPKEVVSDSNNKETSKPDTSSTEVASDNNNKETSKPNTPSAEVASDSNNKETSKPNTISGEPVPDKPKPTTNKTDALDSNAGHKSTEVTSNSNPNTSETPKIMPPPLPNGPGNGPNDPPKDDKPKNTSIEEKKSTSSKLGKYLLWGLIGVCGVGLAVCMVLLVSSK